MDSLRLYVAFVALLGCNGLLPRPAAVPFEPTAAPRVVIQVGPNQAISKVALSRDERVAATTADDVRFWNIKTGALISRWQWEDVGTRDDKLDFDVVALAPDGRRALVATRTLYLIDVSQGKTLGTYARAVPRRWSAAAFAPDGKSALVSADDGKLEIFDVASWKLTGILGRHRATEIEFAADGRQVVTRGSSREITWDFVERRELAARALTSAPTLAFAATGSGISISAGSKRIQLNLPPSLPPIDGVALIAPDLALSGSSRDGSLHVWDLKTLARLSLPAEASWPAVWDGGHGQLLAWSDKGDALLAIDLGTRQVLRRYPLPAAMPRPAQMALLPERSHLVVTFMTPLRALLLDLGSGAVLERPLAGAEGDLADVRLDASGRHLTGGHPRSIQVWNLSDGAQQTLATEFEAPRFATFFADRRYIADLTLEAHRYMDNEKQFLEVYDTRSGKLARSMQVGAGSGGAVAIRADGRQALVGSVDGRVRLYDLDSAQLLQTLAGHNGLVRALALDPNGRFALTGAADGSARLWRLDTGRSVILLARGEDWVVANDRGHFDATRNGARLLSVVADLDCYTLDTVAAPWNRPDLLLQEMGTGASDVVDLLERKFKQRAKALQLERTELADVRFAPRVEDIEARCEGNRCSVAFRLRPGKRPIVQYQVLANGVPLATQKLSPPLAAPGMGRETVVLAGGSNRLEVAAMDTTGTQSPIAFRAVDVAPAATVQTYFVGFGVDDYEDPQLSRLQFAVKDARDLGAALTKTAGEGNAHVRLYTNRGVTGAAFADAQAFLAAARPDDVVIVFVAGHGLHSDALGEFLFLGPQTRTAELDRGGLPLARFHELLGTTAAQRRVLLLDACESGDRDDDERGPVATAAGSTVRARTTRAAQLIAEQAPAVRRVLADRERLIFQDLGHRNGATVFASSRGSEASYEDPALANGVFTHALKTALLGASTPNEPLQSFEQIRRRVEREVPRQTRDRQHPVLLQANPFLNIDLRARANEAQPR
jgi:WD40 repeat protein